MPNTKLSMHKNQCLSSVQRSRTDRKFLQPFLNTAIQLQRCMLKTKTTIILDRFNKFSWEKITNVVDSLPLYNSHSLIGIFQPRNVFQPGKHKWNWTRWIAFYRLNKFGFQQKTRVNLWYYTYLSFIKTPEVIIKETSNGTKHAMATSTDLNAIEKKHPETVTRMKNDFIRRINFKDRNWDCFINKFYHKPLQYSLRKL